MELDRTEKRAVSELGDAVNDAIEESLSVSNAIERLREMGYEPNLNVKLEISLQEIVGAYNETHADVLLDLTEDDVRTLRGMKIKVDD